MSKKELDTLIEQYFRSEVWASPTLNLEMLIEMIEDNYPDISAADPAGIGVDGVNPELVADKVAASGDVSREGVISVLTQLIGSADPGMVDRVMLQISNPQGLSVKGAPQAQINESLTAEQWAKMYRELLLMGVPADTMEAIRILKDSGLTAEQLKGMLSQQTMTDLKSVQTAPVTGVGDRWSLEESKKTGRFSYTIGISSLVPNEAWGDPDSQSRKDIERIFSSITRKPSIKERILHINSFVDPKEANNKATRGRFNTVLNMMQIIEALQACLNDYNDAAAGFVFEGFMAAVTGGKQISGRVGGTLPIEDFVTGDDEPVSLKLLSPDTGIHGSFTNLVDYLFIRGGSGISQIKYLIARKNTEGDDVSELAIWDFIIDRQNFINIMIESKNVKNLLGEKTQELAAHVQAWNDSPEWRKHMFVILKETPGYTKNKGMFYKNLDDAGNFDEKGGAPPDPALKARKYDIAILQAKGGIWAAEQAEKDAATGKADFEGWLSQYPELQKIDKRDLNKLKINYEQAYREAAAAQQVTESYFGEFHEREKRLMKEERLLMESGKSDGGSQWTITRTEMTDMRKLATVQFYGEINLSAQNIDACAKIYIDKMGKDMVTLLDTTKSFTENIGKYFSSKRRDHAASASNKAIREGEKIVDTLQAEQDVDPNKEL